MWLEPLLRGVKNRQAAIVGETASGYIPSLTRADETDEFLCPNRLRAPLCPFGVRSAKENLGIEWLLLLYFYRYLWCR